VISNSTPPQQPQEEWIALSKALQRTAARKGGGAATLLLEKIENGAIRSRAHHVLRGGSRVRGPLNEALLPADWQKAQISWEEGHFLRPQYLQSLRLDRVEAFAIELNLADLDREFPGAAAPAPENSTIRRRSAKFEWDIVFSEFVLRFHLGGIPNDDRALAAEMFKWCLDYFKDDKKIPGEEKLASG
jgi:hypothetical protein